jgi:hypothetical protein
MISPCYESSGQRRFETRPFFGKQSDRQASRPVTDFLLHLLNEMKKARLRFAQSERKRAE